MKCQQGKTCVKRPSTAPSFPKGAKFCTGCDKPGKDVKPLSGKSNKDVQPLSDRTIKSNISVLGFLKESVFQGDHSGIDRMAGEMRSELRRRRRQHTGLRTATTTTQNG